MSFNQSVAIVVTTIGDGEFLGKLRPVLSRGNSSVSVIVIGDVSTPPSCADAVRRMAAEGFQCSYFGPEAQVEFLRAVPRLADEIPWNSDNRRNVGVLEAWRRGVDVIVSIDDDNEPCDPADFLAQYGAVGTERCLPCIESSNGWINVCAMLECRSAWFEEEVRVYPRGFPLSRRGADHTRITENRIKKTVAMHLGLWLGEPDIDAASRSATAARSISLRCRQPVAVAPGCRLPLSTQNIAIARRVVPAWWFVRMGAVVNGMRMDRFGDMFQGYFATLAIQAMGDTVAVGAPLVNHHRNPHRMLNDLAGELPGMALLEALLPLIEAEPPAASSYEDAYRRIANDLAEAGHKVRDTFWKDSLQKWGNDTSRAMEAWIDACKVLA